MPASSDMADAAYLDNAASSVPRPEALEALLSRARDRYANPSATHALGQAARAALEEARAQVAALVGAEAREVVFASGATEANDLAIRGVLEPLLEQGKPAHAVTTAIEHSSVTKTFEALARRGLKLSVVAPRPDGAVRADAVLAAVGPDTALVSVTAASNELGTLQPVAEIAAGLLKMRKETDPGLRRGGGVVLHTDAVQAVVSSMADFKTLGADLMTVSAHKIGGSKGVGSLVIRRGLRLSPTLHGGGQEGGLRSGTENVPGIAAFGAAAEALRRKREEETGRYRALRERLLGSLAASGRAARPLLPTVTPVAPHILPLECPGMENDFLVLLLSRAGAMVSAGSACKSGSREASSVLTALGLPDVRAKSVIRVSFGHATTEGEVDRFVEALGEALKKRAR